jgi:hypothetical protein
MFDFFPAAIAPEKVNNFKQQLDARVQRNPELATSPFLLSLMIEVYKKKGDLPSQRVELYREQVKGIVSRCIEGPSDNKQEESSVLDLEKSRSNDKVLQLAIEYLEVCSFVCQMLREERDFKLATCSQELKRLWSHDAGQLAKMRALLSDDRLVGLLSKVDDVTYRFSHLTLQEYLAARCAVRRYQHDVAELIKHLEPLHSRWRREVLQFTACMLEDQVFTKFCHSVLQREDGAGAHCELVRAFLSERGDSEEVKQMLEAKLREFRGADKLVAGLCHPSPDVRELLLSEMQQFETPPDPFADGGLVAALQNIAEDTSSTWHQRRAGILSMAQIAQKEYCNKDAGTGRAETLKWMIKTLNADAAVREDIHFALVKGLGTVLSKSNKGHEEQLFLMLDDVIERTFLEMLIAIDSVAVSEAVADLNLYSDGLVDWLSGDLFGSHLVTTGRWPLRHMYFICDRVVEILVYSQLQHVDKNDPATLASHATNLQRASRLVLVLFGRLHSPSFEPDEEVQLRKALGKVVPILGDGCIAHTILELLMVKGSAEQGSAEQGARVLRMLASLNIAVENESFDILGLDRENALPLLEALEELNEGPDRLAAWFAGKPHLVSDHTLCQRAWPMRNVLFIFNRIPVAKFGDKALLSQLAYHLMARVHSNSFEETDRADAMTALARLCAGGANFAAVKFLGTGDPEQRIRTLEILAEVKVDIGRQSLDQLSLYLLASDIKIIPAGVSVDDFKTQLCMCQDSATAARCYWHRNNCSNHQCRYELRQQLCKKWIQDACTSGKRCKYAHGTNESLLTRILTKEERRTLHFQVTSQGDLMQLSVEQGIALRNPNKFSADQLCALSLMNEGGSYVASARVSYGTNEGSLTHPLEKEGQLIESKVEVLKEDAERVQEDCMRFDFETCWRDWKSSGFRCRASSTGRREAVTYMCELVVDGKIEVSPIKASHLSLLPGKPSNSSLPHLAPESHREPAQQDDEDADAFAGQGVKKDSPWQVGTLVRLLDDTTDSNSHLAPGRGARSIGCIASVDLHHNKVSVYVCTDRALSECSHVKIGDKVRLVTGYAAVYDAIQGPMVPGQIASVKALQDGLVLVESVGEGGVNAKWWYQPEALVLASASVSKEDSSNAVCFDSIKDAGACNNGECVCVCVCAVCVHVFVFSDL